MAWKKIHRRLVTALIRVTVTILLLASAISATDWQTLTSFTDVRRFCEIDDTLFVVTSGGLLGIVDRNAPGKTSVNLDGLGTNDLTDMIVDADGRKWVTGDGRLVRFGGDNHTVFPTGPIYGDLRLLTIEDDGDNLWIGCDSGLILFSKVNEGGQYQNRFRITSVNQFPAVYDIVLDGDSIWLATAVGLAVADRTVPSQLVSPANWTVYNASTNAELGSNQINRLALFEDRLYVGGFGGLFEMEGSGGFVTFLLNPVVGSREITDLVENNDSLFVYSSRGLVSVADGASELLYPLTTFGTRPVAGYNNGNFRWVAVQAGGVYHNATGIFTAYPYIGMPENVVADVAVTGGGVVTALFDTKALGQLVADEWLMTTFEIGSRTTKVRIDSAGAIWAGTFGAGVYRIVDDDVRQFDQTNTPLNVDGNGDIVLSAATASERHIFLASLNPVAGYPIAYCDINDVDNPGAWQSIGVVQGLSDNTIISLDYMNGELAIGTDNNGVFFCRPFASTVTCRHLTEDDNNLVSNTVRTVRYAPDGALWVGTNFGLSRYQIELGRDIFETVDLPFGFGPDIATLEIDGRGNVWIGARNGLAFYDITDGSVTVYTTSNSGLVDNEPRGMALDPTTGDLYIATNFGLSRLFSRFGTPTDDIEQVLAFPNPYMAGAASDRLRFNFNRAGTVRIFSVAGDLVATVDVNEGWNGVNDSGKEVASGVYLFVITDEDGNVGKGKILLVRQ
ncbi:T9SS type A sorting domain-containing protein [bacterium]|nr:T9SS type A sorting domain-containing protein [bacterium]